MDFGEETKYNKESFNGLKRRFCQNKTKKEWIKTPLLDTKYNKGRILSLERRLQRKNV